jgi:hypothetical protein
VQIGRKDAFGWLSGVFLALAALWLAYALCSCRHRPVLLPQPIIRYVCEDGWTLAGKTCYIHVQAKDAKKVNMATGAAGDVTIFSAACADAEEPGMVVCKKPATVGHAPPAVRHIAPGQVPSAMM